MSNINNELAKLGKEIEAAKKSIATLEGRKTEIMERLKTDYGVSTIKEAESLLTKTQSSVDKLEKEIESDFKELKENFSW
jgi:predicted  nucleic acid-binding Zn-ribbon protein